MWARKGADAVGWYASFHTHTEEVWGIYLHEERLNGMANQLYNRGKSGITPEAALKLITWMVYWHEMFHAKVEAVLTGLELVAHNKKYLQYKNGVYDKARNKKCWWEEALANWDAMRIVKKNFGEKQFEILKPWLTFCPPRLQALGRRRQGVDLENVRHGVGGRRPVLQRWEAPLTARGSLACEAWLRT